MALLEVTDLDVFYRPRDHAPLHAVRGVSLSIGEGEFVGLVGESGCGKSTLGNAILRLLTKPAVIEGGSVVFDGVRVDTADDEELRRLRWTRLSTVFQSSMNSLNPVLTVGRQFADTFAAHRDVLTAEQRALGPEKATVELLEMVSLDAGVLTAYPHELSGGMKQRVALALALALRPKLVILDEPTTGLDVLVQRRILDRVRELQERLHFAVLFVSHDIGAVLEMSDRVMVMYEGEIVEEAPAERILAAPQHPYTTTLLNAYRLTLGTDVRPAHAEAPRVVLQLEDVHKTYTTGRGRARTRVTALDGVTLTLRERSVSALVGQSGSGKSTIARMVLGIERPDAGSVRFSAPDGTSVDIGRLRGRALRRVRSEVQMVFQDPFSSLNPTRTLGYILSRPLRNYVGVSGKDARAAAIDLLDSVGLTPAEGFIDRMPHQLSGGQRQRVVIARALAARPRILIADEPVSMLDVSIRAEILELLRTLVAERRLAMLYITHDLLSARALADDVTVLESGRVVESGDTDAVIHHAEHPYTRELLAAVPDPFARQ